MNYIICRYSEIALKKKNRGFFERLLIENIKKRISNNHFIEIKKISGRILVSLTEEGFKNKEDIAQNVASVFGISSSSFAQRVDCNIEAIKKGVNKILKEKEFKTFRVTTKRSDKRFEFNSQEINEKVGESVLKEYNKAKVNLVNPDITCFIEIVQDYALIYTNKTYGFGGLPVGSSGKAISMISGGIDSPVASFEAMKRGIKLIYVHFHTYPETSKLSIKKVEKLVKILNRFQGSSKLYLVPFSEIQKEIFLNCLPKLRVVLYRRIMFQITDIIAEKEKCEAIITGESVGQVASQTLENMNAIKNGIEKLIISPLICENKESIIQKARKIGTYETSILPYEDSCSRFLPKYPETKATIDNVLIEEKKINKDKIIEEAIKNTKILSISNTENKV